MAWILTYLGRDSTASGLGGGYWWEVGGSWRGVGVDYLEVVGRSWLLRRQIWAEIGK